MKLFAMLIALILERYFHLSSMQSGLRVFEHYIQFVETLIEKFRFPHPALKLVALLAPLVALVAALSFTLTPLFYGLGSLLLSLAVLLLCMTPSEDPTETSVIPAGIYAILWPSYQRFFAVLFWFIVLGPAGAVLYRLSTKVHSHLAHADAMGEWNEKWCAILDWVPIRLLSLIYALVGNFAVTFSHWLDRVVTPAADNQAVFIECASIALGVENTQLTETQQQAAAALNDRALIVWIIMVALFTLGASL